MAANKSYQPTATANSKKPGRTQAVTWTFIGAAVVVMCLLATITFGQGSSVRTGKPVSQRVVPTARPAHSSVMGANSGDTLTVVTPTADDAALPPSNNASSVLQPQQAQTFQRPPSADDTTAQPLNASPVSLQAQIGGQINGLDVNVAAGLGNL